ncbi:MAG: NAD(P)-dependent oxidoreductase, partial [Alphaproteobacteria bacterium]
IDESAFAKMNRKPILINCGRGGLVNEMALVKALNEEQISGAGFDVLSKEPPDTDDPNPFLKLADLPNVIITPHVGWASGNAMQAAADMLISNINAFQAGKPENVVVV